MHETPETTLNIRMLVISYYLPSVLHAFANAMLAPVFPLYVRDYGISYALVGVVLSAAAMGGLFMDLPASLVMRRMGRKRTMLAGITLMATSSAALFFVGDIQLVIAVRVAGGVGGALFMLSRHAYITTAIKTRARGRAIAALGGSARIGAFLGPVIGGLIASSFSFQAVFLACAALQAVSGLLILLWLQDQNVSRKLTAEKWRQMGTALRDTWRQITPAIVGRVSAIVIRRGRGIIVPLFASEALGLDVAAIGFIVTAGAIAEVLLVVPAGLVMDRFGRRWAVVPCFVTLSIGMFCLPFTTGFVSLLLVVLFMGVGNGLGSGTMMTLGADLAPRGIRGEFIAVWRFTGSVGGLACPTGIGIVAQALSLSAAGLAVAGVGLLGAAVFAFLVPETLVRESAPTAQSDQNS